MLACVSSKNSFVLSEKGICNLDEIIDALAKLTKLASCRPNPSDCKGHLNELKRKISKGNYEN